MSIFQYLRDLTIPIDDKLLVLFPEQVTPKNYMALIICLRRYVWAVVFKLHGIMPPFAFTCMIVCVVFNMRIT